LLKTILVSDIILSKEEKMKSLSLSVIALVVLMGLAVSLQSQAKEIHIGSVSDIQDNQIIVTVSDLTGFNPPPEVASWKWSQLQQTGTVIISIKSRETVFNLYLTPEAWHQFGNLVNQADEKIGLLSQLKQVPFRPWSVEQVLRQQELLDGETVLVAGTIKNIGRHRLIFGIRYTSFDLYGKRQSFLKVQFNRKVYYQEGTKIVVQGRFNKSRGLIEASDVRPE
jgi:hypothetical protein